ncbi:MAG: outer membrane beta-barrel protein [Bacteroidales bacterium]|nr:outer membrane beta-barrel protein [Bacteroidales bacterium]
MNRVLKCLSLVAVLAILGMNQSKAQTDFSIHVGMASPLSSFADSRAQKGVVAWMDKTDRAGAGLGFEAGMKFRFAVPSINGLGIIATSDVFYNGANSDVKDFAQDFVDYYAIDQNYDECRITVPNYINIPVMIGANYEYGVANNVKIWAEFGLGMDFGLMTNHEYYWEVSNIELMSEKVFDNNVSFAYQLGAGVMLSDKFSLGVHYYALGSQKIQGEEFIERITSQGSQTADSKFTYRSINPTIFTLRLGYHF